MLKLMSAITSAVENGKIVAFAGKTCWKAGESYFIRSENSGKRGRTAASKGNLDALLVRSGLSKKENKAERQVFLQTIQETGTAIYNGVEYSPDENGNFVLPVKTEEERAAVLPKAREKGDFLDSVRNAIKRHVSETGKLPVAEQYEAE